MQEKTVEFKDKKERKIVGTLIFPEGEGPFPAVIVCHGFKGHRYQTHIRQIAEEIAKKGVVSFRFDFTHDPGESSLPFEEMTISYELEVLEQAIDFLRHQSSVDQNRIGLTGHSLGGLVVSWYAANHPEITSLVTLSAVYSFILMWKKMYGDQITAEMEEKGFSHVYSNTLQKDLKLNKSYYEDAVAYDMDKMIENVNCPILIIQGTDDKLLDHAQHYFDRVQTPVKQLKIIDKADHNYTNPQHLDQVKNAAAEWFAKTLG